MIPPALETAPSDVSRAALGMVPLAMMRIMASGGQAVPPVVMDASVGITHPTVATILRRPDGRNRLRHLLFPGQELAACRDGEFLLWMISTRHGVASLSQAQIVLWTFLIAASAVYVMALSGVLIEISEGTLILLGISGVALVGSKLQQNKDSNQSDGKLAVPGPVAGVQQVEGLPTTRSAWPGRGRRPGGR